MIRSVRVRAGVAALAFVLAAWHVAPAAAAEPPKDDQARVLALLGTGCAAARQPWRASAAAIAAAATTAATKATVAATAPEATPSAESTWSAVAQASPAASASPDASPSPNASSSPSSDATPVVNPSPSPEVTIPPPRTPSGPQILVPPIPTARPAATPPPLPSPSPSTSPSLGPVIIPATEMTPSANGGQIQPAGGASPIPTGTPEPAANEKPLGEDEFAILSPDYIRNGKTQDFMGPVNIFYRDGVVVGDHAHYDGERYIDVTGHPYIRNRAGDTVLRGEVIRFDTRTNRATLTNGTGETTQGVERGRLYYRARSLETQRNGVTHGEKAFLTTCDNPRGGYHLESKTLDVYPGDKAVARKVTLYLGALAILYLPFVVISLKRDPEGARKTPGFVPLIGYSSAEGFYIKARLGFSPSDTYSGYYRVEYETKIGLGLGYVAYYRPRGGRRSTDLDFFRQYDRRNNSKATNFAFRDQENFSPTMRGTFGFSYQGNYGPLVTLPPSYNFNAALDRSTPRDSSNIAFTRQQTSGQYDSDSLTFSDTHRFNERLSNQFNLGLTRTQSSYTGATLLTHQAHYTTLTSYVAPGEQYDFKIDRYLQQNPSSYDTVPELQIRPRGSLFPRLQYLPVNATFTVGRYNDHQPGDVSPAGLETTREELQLNFGPGITRTAFGDFTASMNVRQDAYGTGDLKAQIIQNAQLNTPLGPHIANAITYNEQHLNGPPAEPFKSLDVLGAGGTKGATEVFKLFNGDVYLLTLSTGTSFLRQAQPISYALQLRPSPRSYVTLGGAYNPGPGNGFLSTVANITTPFGRGTEIQFSTLVDWKARGRLEQKTIYLRKIIGDCYEMRIDYNQSTRAVNLSLDLLAFPSRAVNLGIGQTGTIFPQNFSTDQVFR